VLLPPALLLLFAADADSEKDFINTKVLLLASMGNLPDYPGGQLRYRCQIISP
jgi:hypothetical protein